MAVLAGSAVARAEWQISAGPKATILYTLVEHETALLFGCANGSFSFGVGSDYLGPFPEEAGDAFLSIQIDDGLRHEAKAAYRRRDSGGFDVVYLAVDELGAIIGEIIGAKSTIRVELQHMGFGERFSWTADAKGSTKTGRELVEKCGIVQPSAAAPAALTWETTIGPDAINGGEEATLLGYLENNAFLSAYCDSRGAVWLSLLAVLPYEVGDVGLNLHLEIDGEGRVATGEYFSLDNGLSGVSYMGGDYVASTIKAIADAKVGVRMKVQDYSDGSMREWAALDLAGLTAATDAFNAKCFGMAPASTVAETPAVSNPVAPDPAPVSATNWTVERGNEVSVPGAGAVLLGLTSPTPGYMQITCSPDAATWSIGFAANDAASFPVGGDQGPFKVILDMGQYDWTFEQGRYASDGGRTGVMSSAGDVAGFSAALTLQLEPFTLTLVEANGIEHEYVLSTDGLGEASAAMFETCYGLR